MRGGTEKIVVNCFAHFGKKTIMSGDYGLRLGILDELDAFGNFSPGCDFGHEEELDRRRGGGEIERVARIDDLVVDHDAEIMTGSFAGKNTGVVLAEKV